MYLAVTVKIFYEHIQYVVFFHVEPKHEENQSEKSDHGYEDRK